MGQSISQFGYALNTLGGAGEDFNVNGGQVFFAGIGWIPWEQIITPITKTAYVAAVLRTTTLTFSAPAATGENFQVSLKQPQGGSAPQLVQAPVTATTTNATTTAQSWGTAFDGYVTTGVLFGTRSGGAAVITISGTAAYPLLMATGSTSNIAIVTTVAGSAEVNLGASLLLAGIDTAVATTHYTTYTIQLQTQTGQVENTGVYRDVIFAISESASGASTLIAQIDAVLGGGVSQGSPALANPELIGKL